MQRPAPGHLVEASTSSSSDSSREHRSRPRNRPRGCAVRDRSGRRSRATLGSEPARTPPRGTNSPGGVYGLLATNRPPARSMPFQRSRLMRTIRDAGALPMRIVIVAGGRSAGSDPAPGGRAPGAAAAGAPYLAARVSGAAGHASTGRAAGYWVVAASAFWSRRDAGRVVSPASTDGAGHCRPMTTC